MATPKRLPSSKRSAPVNRFSKFGDIKKTVDSRIKKFEAKNRYQKTIVFAQKKPFTSFFIALITLFIIIFLGSTIFSVKAPKIETRTEAKNVDVFNIGENAKITVQGKVKKGGVIKIVAQSPGIISSINALEGQELAKGKTIISLSSNYQGGNAASLQRQLAALTYQNTKETYDIQKGLIERQRDLANRQSENSDTLRDITSVSIDETRTLINLNSEILNTVKSNIQSLEQSNGDPAQILSLQQIQAQLQAGNNQLQASLRANEYQTNEDDAAVDLGRISKDIALAQLDLQQKGLEMSLKTSGISLQLAKIQEANMYPSSPFAGTVQKIHVKVGDNVTPGMTLVTFSGSTGEVVVDAKVSKETADKVSVISKSKLFVNGKVIDATPSYISSEATDGQLYSVLFAIDENYKSYFTDNSFISVTLPISQNLESPYPFIPVDSVFQTQDEAYVYVAENGKASSKKVELGSVTGGYVTVIKGLSKKDQVILSRNVIEGEIVKINK